MSPFDQHSTIAHYHPVWLPGTMTWLYEQINGLRSHAQNLVICERQEKHDQFPFQDLYTFAELPLLEQMMQRVQKKCGLSTVLPFYPSVLRKQQVALLHSHFGHVAWTGSQIARVAGVPHVASFYGMDVRQIPQQHPVWLTRYAAMFAQTSRIFCEGNYMAGTIASLGCPPEKITVHPLGINLSKIPFLPRHRRQDEPLRILIAASFREKKGIPIALKAVAGVMNTTDVRVTLVGDASADGASLAEKQRILDTIRQENLSSRVDFKGFVPHSAMLELAQKHHIFLSPSLHARDGDCEGGAPVSIIEMAASGMIIVSSRHCDIPGVVEHERTGWLAHENDLDDITRQLHAAIDAQERWETMARHGRQHIEAHFDASVQAERLFGHYQDVINGFRSGRHDDNTDHHA